MQEVSGNALIWEVNHPQASYFGAIWETAIRSVCKVIGATLLDLQSRLLSEEVFETLLCSASKIINSTPLWPRPSSLGEPQPISPDMLLTQRESMNPMVSQK